MIGIALPQITDGEQTSSPDLLAFLTSAEQAGYESAWVTEALPSQPALDPLAVLAVAAAHTRRMRLGSAVLVLPRYRAGLLARSVASIDQLSNGRLTLGIGIGGPADSEAGLGGPRNQRAQHFEDTIAELRRLWSEEEPQVVPRPVQAPLPIWIGASAPAALRRAARIADGWICSARADHDRFAAEVATLQDALHADGRGAKDFTIAKRAYVAIGQHPSDVEAWFRAAVGGGPPPGNSVIAGDLDEVEDRLTELNKLGAHVLVIQAVGHNERHQMEALAEHGTVERLRA